MKPVLVLSSVDSEDAARRIAEVLLERRLAACVSISAPWTSHYTWKGKRECAREHLLLIKSLSENAEALSRALKEVHPYECPEIIVVEGDAGNPAYGDWLWEQCGGGEIEKN